MPPPTKPILGTDQATGWRYYSIHLTISYVMKERMLVENYRRCINLALTHGQETEALFDVAEKRGIGSPRKNEIVQSAHGLAKWAKGLKDDDYHDVYVHSFIGLWSSLEEGLENIVADYIGNDRDCAEAVVGRISSQKVSMKAWPWSAERRLYIASKAEDKAIKMTPQGKNRLFERLQELFSWLGMDIDLNEPDRGNLAEAKLVRNILLHRNGNIGPQDVAKCASLGDFVGGVIPFDKERFWRYSGAVSNLLLSLLEAASQKEAREGRD